MLEDTVTYIAAVRRSPAAAAVSSGATIDSASSAGVMPRPPGWPMAICTARPSCAASVTAAASSAADARMSPRPAACSKALPPGTKLNPEHPPDWSWSVDPMLDARTDQQRPLSAQPEQLAADLKLDSIQTTNRAAYSTVARRHGGEVSVGPGPGGHFVLELPAA